jgi:hypothetical protein
LRNHGQGHTGSLSRTNDPRTKSFIFYSLTSKFFENQTLRRISRQPRDSKDYAKRGEGKGGVAN